MSLFPRRTANARVAILCLLFSLAFSPKSSSVLADPPQQWTDVKEGLADHVPANRSIRIGPINGLTTEWHPVPQNCCVPIGTKLQLELAGLSKTDKVQWNGAREFARSNSSSKSACMLMNEGEQTIEVVVTPREGNTWNRSIQVQVIDVRPQDISCNVEVSASPFDVDEDSSNETTLEYFFPVSESIAHIGRIGPNHYRTSVARTFDLRVATEPAGFESMMEWRRGDSTIEFGEKLTRQVFDSPGTRTFSTGAIDRQEDVRVDIYNVEITSHQTDLDEIPEGQMVTFVVSTDPPGHEEDVRWLSSTKFGSAMPVVGHGPTFSVRFEDTWGELPDGSQFRWLGVRADNAAFGNDNNCSANESIIVSGVQVNGSDNANISAFVENASQDTDYSLCLRLAQGGLSCHPLSINPSGTSNTVEWLDVAPTLPGQGFHFVQLTGCAIVPAGSISPIAFGSCNVQGCDPGPSNCEGWFFCGAFFAPCCECTDTGASCGCALFCG